MRNQWLLVGLAVCVGCGALVPGKAKVGSCDFRNSGDSTLRCETISDTDVTRQDTTIATLKATCNAVMGVFIDGDCPKAGIVAGCQLGGNQSGAGETTTNWYYDNPDAGMLDHFGSPADVKANKCDKGDAPSTLVNP